MAEREERLLLYCIGDASPPLPDNGRGVRGRGLGCITHGELAAVVSSVAEPAWVATPTREELLEYERVIHSRHAVADVVPMRFGSVLSDEEAVRAHLEEQRAAYLRALTRVSGCVEMGARALISLPPPVTPEESAKPALRSGVDYLKARQRRYSAETRLRDHCAALEQALLSKVAPLCREHRSELTSPRSAEPALCSLYFLVPRDQMSAFRAALSSIPDIGHTELMLSGPWPPFNFVD
jgi:hypothetical protein